MEWRKIKGFASWYEVSDTGLIKTHNWKNLGVTKIMKPALDGGGYLRTVLKSECGKLKTVKVHRIMAAVWIKNPENKPQVNHRDGVKTNNAKGNLEWVTFEENIQHCIDNKLQTPFKGEEVGTSKLTEVEVLEIRSKFSPRVYTRKMLSEEYGVAPATIKDIVLRKSWKHI
jgi:hypothetical protein